MSAERIYISPPAVREFAPHYWDCFRVPSAGNAPPRVWAKLAVGAADSANRAFGNAVWHGLLGFDLAARTAPQTFVGWRVTTDTPECYVMDTDGSRMAGRMVFARAGDDLEWTTMLRYHGWVGRAVWSVIGHAHRVIAPRNLDAARRRLAG